MQNHIYSQSKYSIKRFFGSFGTLKGGQEGRDSNRDFFGADCVAFCSIVPLDLFASVTSLVKDDIFEMQKNIIHQFIYKWSSKANEKEETLINMLIKDINPGFKDSIMQQKEKAMFFWA